MIPTNVPTFPSRGSATTNIRISQRATMSICQSNLLRKRNVWPTEILIHIFPIFKNKSFDCLLASTLQGILRNTKLFVSIPAAVVVVVVPILLSRYYAHDWIYFFFLARAFSFSCIVCFLLAYHHTNPSMYTVSIFYSKTRDQYHEIDRQLRSMDDFQQPRREFP